MKSCLNLTVEHNPFLMANLDSYILIMKANEMHCLSDLFDKALYMFRTCPLSIIRSVSTLNTRKRYLSFQRGQDDLASRHQQNQNDKHLLRVYSVEILLMMDSGHFRNMQSTLSNKSENYCISLAFIIRILQQQLFYDAVSNLDCPTPKHRKTD